MDSLVGAVKGSVTAWVRIDPFRGPAMPNHHKQSTAAAAVAVGLDALDSEGAAAQRTNSGHCKHGSSDMKISVSGDSIIWRIAAFS